MNIRFNVNLIPKDIKIKKISFFKLMFLCIFLSRISYAQEDSYVGGGSGHLPLSNITRSVCVYNISNMNINFGVQWNKYCSTKPYTIKSKSSKKIRCNIRDTFVRDSKVSLILGWKGYSKEYFNFGRPTEDDQCLGANSLTIKETLAGNSWNVSKGRPGIEVMLNKAQKPQKQHINDAPSAYYFCGYGTPPARAANAGYMFNQCSAIKKGTKQEARAFCGGRKFYFSSNSSKVQSKMRNVCYGKTSQPIQVR